MMSCSGVVEGDMVLSLQQTVTEPKAVETEEQEVEKEEDSEVDVMKIFKQEKSSPESSESLYEKFKSDPEALSELAPAAGDTIISLNSPGQYSTLVSCAFGWNILNCYKL